MSKDNLNVEDNEEILEEASNEIEDNQEENLESEELSEEDKLKIEMESLVVKVQGLENDVARAYADAKNYERRARIDADNLVTRKVSGVVEKILPALDNFERALKVDSQDATVNNFLKGFEMIYQQLYAALEEEGIKQIDALNKPFDSEYHQAISTVNDENYEAGVVVEELQKGYTLNGKVIRHTLVKVNE